MIEIRSRTRNIVKRGSIAPWYELSVAVLCFSVPVMAALCDDLNINIETTASMEAAVDNGVLIRDALKEREKVLDEDSIPMCLSGSRHSYFRSRQISAEKLVDQRFVNLDEPIAGSKQIVMYTIPAWRAATGINADGFKRITQDGETVAYGPIEDTDRFGSYISDELIGGLRLLEATLRISEQNVSCRKYANIPRCSADEWDDLKESLLGEWNSSPTESRDEDPVVYAVDVATDDNAANWETDIYGEPYRVSDGFTSGRCWGQVAIKQLPTFIPCSAEAYLLPSGSLDPEDELVDMDDIGFIRDCFWKAGEFESSAEDERCGTEWVGPEGPSPHTLVEDFVPDFYDEENNFFTVRCVGSYWVLKWEFENCAAVTE